MTARQVVAAELTWSDGALQPALAVWVDDDGRIGRIGPLADAAAASDSGGGEAPIELRRLPGIALLPGFVDAHSHAFQRGLRGQGERFPSAAPPGGGAGSFWTWREAMYGLVESLRPERLFDLTLQAFREMRRAGITSVGEFHYLHHSGGGADFVGDEAVLAAGAEAGIRLVLLQAYYKTGGIGAPLSGAQRRFETATLGGYWKQLEHLAGRLDGRTQSLGVVGHSIRAVPLAELRGLLAESRRQRLPFHIHVEEQQQEIAESRAVYGKRPLELLLEQPGGLEGVTAVHCTHSRPDQLRRFVQLGGRICVCPLTEANLGDGIPPLAAVPESHRRLALGTDSNARISLLEEMRWLEYGQRLKSETRGVLADESGAVAPLLLAAGTAGGAASLGLTAGRLAPGAWADFVAVDLASPLLAPANGDGTLAALIFGTTEKTLVATYVGGAWDRDPNRR
ncbi:MAG TPA: formimidoylglutamate deiminase [Thermoanaerobaculia bacterium]|nr:formimidoylglutamate deiminase [Thermoanaerobaculia bacterium]